MNRKKKFFSIVAGFSIASLMLGAGNTEAASYTVQKGDSLWSISQKYGTSVNDIKKANNLTNTIIYPNQIIEVGSSSPISSSSVTSTSYTIKAGDTLFSISRQFNVTVADLMAWNNLNSALIYVGDTLNVSGASASINSPVSNTSTIATNIAPAANAGYDVNKLVNVAKSLIGTPYKWGGTTPAGFDCSGFVYYVFKQAGMDISRLDAVGFYNRSKNVDSPQAGDLVFFEGTYKSGVSDVGIYLGNNQFISASDKGVSIKSLDNSYWKSHFNSIKRLY
ncbi:LysM peptidoglycan-binding domain-containing protein [Niallia oryzisoli]|uniref:C40 family peptidase n=1 Tax=Niallia oryzisoli TaxID=1737571 RepID=UPI003735C71E